MWHDDLVCGRAALGHLRFAATATDSAGLLRFTAGLSGLLALKFDAVEDRRAARGMWDAAINTADASGDRPLAVWLELAQAERVGDGDEKLSIRTQAQGRPVPLGSVR